MNYFSQAEQSYLRLKQDMRKEFMDRQDQLTAGYELGVLTADEQKEYYFLVLATRIYRAKFFAMPAYTNEELAFLIGCSSGTYLGLIAARQKDCSPDMAVQMASMLSALEMIEGMQPIQQPKYPGKE